MAELAPRGYGAGAYGRAPYENFSYQYVAARGNSQVTKADVPFFLVLVWNDLDMTGVSTSGPATAEYHIDKLIALEGAGMSGPGMVSPGVERFLALRGTSESGGIAPAQVTLGMALWGQSLSGGEAYVYNVKSHRQLLGSSASLFIGTHQTIRPVNLRGVAFGEGTAVLSPLWNCGEVQASEWECADVAGATWEDVTVTQSAWQGRR